MDQRRGPAQQEHQRLLDMAKTNMTSSRAGRIALGLLAVLVTLTALPLAAGPAVASSPGSGTSCTVSWDGGGSSFSWHDPLNWSTDQVPEVDDVVCIKGLQAPVRHDADVYTPVLAVQSDGPLTVTSGTLDLTDPSSVGVLTVEGSGRVLADGDLAVTQLVQGGGTIGGAGALTVNGPFAWTGGRQDGPGTTRIGQAAGAGLTLSGGATRTAAGRAIDASVGLTWLDGGELVTDEATVLTLGAAKVVSGRADIVGPGRVQLNGSLDIESGMSVEGPFDTAGSASVQVKNSFTKLQLLGGGDEHGDFFLAHGTELLLDQGNYTVRPDGSIIGTDGGKLSVGDAESPVVLTLQGQLQVAETFIFAAAVARVGEGSNLGEVSLDGTSALEVYGKVTASKVFQDGADVRGPGTLTATGDYTWWQGSMTGPGSTATQGTLHFKGENNNRTIENRWVDAKNVVFDDDSILTFAGDDSDLLVTDLIDVHKIVELKGSAKQIGAARIAVTAGGSLVSEPRITVGTDAKVTVEGDSYLELDGGGVQYGTLAVDGGSTVALGGQMEWAEGSKITFGKGTFGVGRDSRVEINGEAKFDEIVTGPGDLILNTVATASSVESTGLIEINSTNALMISPGGYRQYGFDDPALIVHDQDSVLAAGDGSVEIDAGWVSGKGMIKGNVTSYGRFIPDGRLAIGGSYTQTSEGKLITSISGDTYHALNIYGAAKLDGTLNVEVFAPATQNARVLTAEGGRTGEFATLTGATGCAGVVYTPVTAEVAPQPCVAVGTGSAIEKGGSITFPVAFSDPPAAPVTIHYSTVDDSAIAGKDFVAQSQDLVVPAGQKAATISIPLIDDDKVEPTETFTLRVTSDGATLGTGEVIGTIIDDDEEPAKDPELEVNPIPMDGEGGVITGINDTHIVGYHGVLIGEEHWGWGYKIADGETGYLSRVDYALGINTKNHLIGLCNDTPGWACFRADKVNHALASMPGTSADPRALNDSDVIVGSATQQSSFTNQPVIWSDPAQIPTPLPLLPGAPEGSATDVNNGGTVVGWAGTQGANAIHRAFVWNATDGLTEIPTLAGFETSEASAVNDKGVVVGFSWNHADGTKAHGWSWNKEDGLLDLGEFAPRDINASGDVVGTNGQGHGALWRNGKLFALGDVVKGNTSYAIADATVINAAGDIGAIGFDSQGTKVFLALTAPGKGCKVCLDFHTQTKQFPNPDAWVPTSNEIVDGNALRMTAALTNNDSRDRSVSVVFSVDGETVGADEHVTTLKPAEKITFEELWDTNGKAWLNGLAAGPHKLVATLAYEDGIPMVRQTIEMKVTPRPVVLVHGMNSNAATWSAYQGFLDAANPGWKAYAVDTMDTSSLVPGSIAENAAKEAAFIDDVQRTNNAWQVDLVAHSMGGLISRSYIQNLMPAPGGVRAVDRLVMLGTPNGGSPCADLFTVPMTFELRSDVMAFFNIRTQDHKGVPFSEATGYHLPFTCATPLPGDDVVPLLTASIGVPDVQQFDIAHTAMTGSPELFTQFVLPRLNGTPAPAPLAADASSATPAPAPAGAADGLTSDDAYPQLVADIEDTVQPGEMTSVPFEVPAGTTDIGSTVLATGDVEVRLVRHHDEAPMATIGVDPSQLGVTYRSTALHAPTAGQWRVEAVNHGSTAATIPLVVWARNTPTRLEGTAAQVTANGKVKVTARITGAALAQPRSSMLVHLTPTTGGEVQTGSIYDDGQHGDGAAGDLVYADTMGPFGPGSYGVLLDSDDATFRRYTTTSAHVEHGVDNPGNDAPVAQPLTVAANRNETVGLTLEALDPEGDALNWEIVTMPAHGQLGGAGDRYDYHPARDYMGEDSFTFRVNDGQAWSATQTASIQVGRQHSQVRYLLPQPVEGTAKRPVRISVQLVDSELQPIGHAPVQFRLGGAAVTADSVTNGFVTADLPLDIPVGIYDLEVSYGGNDTFLPTVLHQPFTVVPGNAPVPSLEGPITGEAGYAVHVLGRGNDPDGDSAKFEFDLQDDGTYDRTVEQVPASNGVDYGQAVDVVYPDAFDGTIRLRVTDAAGHVAEATTPVHIGPHRELTTMHVLRTEVDGRLLDPGVGASISTDGRFVLHNQKDDAVDGGPDPLAVLDRTTGATDIVSVLPDGSVAAINPFGVLSGNGRFVAFAAAVPVNGKLPHEVFLRDRDGGTTTLVSVSGSGQVADWSAEPVAVTDDGRVLFASTAKNLGQEPPNCGTIGQTDAPCFELYLRDPAAGTTTLVSHDADGHPTPVTSSTNAMTRDGRFVVWSENHAVRLWDASTGQVERLGLAAGGADPNGINVAASNFSLSEDGRYVLFTTDATNVVAEDPDQDLDVFRHDRSTGTSILVSVADDGTPGDHSSSSAQMTGDGTLVAFMSLGTNLTGGTGGATPSAAGGDEHWDVFLRDLTAGTTTLVSQEPRDHVAGNNDSLDPSITCDGSTVIFGSDASNLVPGDVNLERDLFAFATGTSGRCGAVVGNHAPVAAGQALTTHEGVALPLTLSGSDADGDALTFTIVDGPDHGSLSGSGAAQTYEPVTGFVGDDTFTFTVRDGEATSAPATVTITVDAAVPPSTTTTTAPTTTSTSTTSTTMPTTTSTVPPTTSTTTAPTTTSTVPTTSTTMPTTTSTVPSTTSTTTPSTTSTTVPTTTSTVPETTSTTAPPTTTTEQPTTTTTAPKGETTTTTTPGPGDGSSTTSTSAPTSTSTTVAGDATTPTTPADPAVAAAAANIVAGTAGASAAGTGGARSSTGTTATGALPVTGSSATGLLTIVGGGLLVVGAVLVVGARRRRAEVEGQGEAGA
jgi:LPXTG-motif cell wall-anchored protein